MQHLVWMWVNEGTLAMTSVLKRVIILKKMTHAMIGQRHSVNITSMTNLMGLFVTCLKWIKIAWAFLMNIFIIMMIIYKLCNSCFLLTEQMKSKQIKPNNESNYHISHLQDSIFVHQLIAPDMIVSKCSKNDTSSIGERNHLTQNVIEKKNEECPGDADGHKLSPYELYHLLKNERDHSYLKKFGFLW